MYQDPKVPLISVILPVYNAGKYLKESIDSILAQSYTDFEFIIVNDGSTDNSKEIISGYSDTRIIFIDQANAGLAAALNKAIQKAQGRYIARQDNDDISDRSRLRKQFDFMEKNDKVMLLGTSAGIINEKGGKTGRWHDHPTDNLSLKFSLLFNNPFVHSSVMFRRYIVDVTGAYDTGSKYFEDYNFWSRISQVGEVANLRERLLQYREVQSGMSKTTDDYLDRVKNQAISNIRFYCPEMPPDEIAHFMNLYLNIVYPGDYRRSIDAVRTTIDAIGKKFCDKLKADEAGLSMVKRRLISEFRRGYYNRVLNSEKSSLLSKLSARVSRRLLDFNSN